MKEPLVTVIIPVYNARRFLGATIRSVLSQTWTRVEAIVVNDGSTDESGGVAHSFVHRGVRVIEQSHLGAAVARNRGLEEAEGEFIQYLDADDLLSPSKIELQVQRLRAEPTGAVATCAWTRFYGHQPERPPLNVHPDFRDYDDPLEWRLQSWGGFGTMPVFTWLLPRHVTDVAGPWNIGLSRDDDGEYFTRVVLSSSKIVFCKDAQGFYRSGNVSLSGSRSQEALRSQFEAIRLSTERILVVEDSQRTRRASACYWQAFLYAAYPEVPDLVREAEARIELLGGGGLKAPVSRPFRPIRDLLGWKPSPAAACVYSPPLLLKRPADDRSPPAHRPHR